MVAEKSKERESMKPEKPTGAVVGYGSRRRPKTARTVSKKPLKVHKSHISTKFNPPKNM